MKQTEKYGLNLFEGSDRLRVGPVNENTEKVEAALGAAAEQAERALGESWQVGDIRHSARGDLDERWLLCNGEAVDGTDYPELDALLFETQGSAFADRPVGTGDLYCAATDGEITVAVGGASSSSVPIIYTANRPDCSWFHILADGNGALRCAAYGGGMWAAGGIGTATVNGSTVYQLVVYTAKDPYGKWERNVIGPAMSSNDYVSGIAFGNGKWVAVSYQPTTERCHVFVADDPAGGWIRHEWTVTTAANMNGVAYGGGQWAICGSGGVVWFTDDPDGTWTRAVTPGDKVLHAIAYGDGVWVAMPQYSSKNVYLTENLAGSWITGTVPGVSNGVSTYYFNPTGLAYRGGVWVAAGSYYVIDAAGGATSYPHICYATNPAGTWTVQVVTKDTASTVCGGPVYAGGMWCVVRGASTGVGMWIFPEPGETMTGLALSFSELGRPACRDGKAAAGGTPSVRNASYPLAWVARSLDGPFGFNFSGKRALYPTLSDTAYDNGKWVSVGSSGTATSGYPVVAVAVDPFGEWTMQQLSTSVSSALTGIAYDNGLWVASGYKGYIWYTDDPLGVWTGVQMAGTNNLTGIAAHEGLWVAYTSGAVWVSDDPTLASAWATATWSSLSAGSLRRLLWADGKWAAVCYDSSYPYVTTAEDPMGTWATGVKVGDTKEVSPSELAFSDGTWWLMAPQSTYNSGSGSTTYHMYLFQAKDPLGEWLDDGAPNGSAKAAGLAADGRNVIGLWGNGSVAKAHRALPAISPDKSYAYIRGKE